MESSVNAMNANSKKKCCRSKSSSTKVPRAQYETLEQKEKKDLQMLQWLVYLI
jgi:hypothetical protein